MRFLLVLAVLMVAGRAPDAGAQPLDLILPTENRALLTSDAPAFYQYTNRTFEGRRSRPWQGGQYGFVRNPRRTASGDLVFTRLHEGVDIRAMRRDRRGEPLDPVRAIDDGRVAYVNSEARYSNYGIYVVVEHIWDGSPFYSLYAHMSRTNARTGQTVEQGDVIGRVGHTGRGVGRTRAHLHFEVNMMLSRHFGRWFDAKYRGGTNRHGLFNGRNLRGLDVGALYRELQRNPDLTISTFLAQQPHFYSVVVPREGPLDVLSRYPWLARHADRISSPSWEISFTRAGLPVAVTPVQRAVREPAVSASPPAEASCYLLTMGELSGQPPDCTLTEDGLESIALLTLATEKGPGQQAW